MLVVMGGPTRGFSTEGLAQQLTGLPYVCQLCPSERYPCTDLAVRIVEPAGWEQKSRECDLLVLPNVGVGVLAKLALLIADEPATAAALQFLIESKPVVAVCDEVKFLLSQEGRVPRPVLDVIRNHWRAAETLGIRLCALSELKSAMGSSPATKAGGRQIVTREDVEEMSRQGRKHMTCPAGSIVTPLAWEAAEKLGIELRVSA